jgi:hypothetical protein
MTIKELIKQCEIRLNYLIGMKNYYVQQNNTEMVLITETEISETEQTIEKLKNQE